MCQAQEPLEHSMSSDTGASTFLKFSSNICICFGLQNQHFVLSTCLRGRDNNSGIHLPTKVCNTNSLQSWEPICLILEPTCTPLTILFTLALRTFYILRRGWEQLNGPENWSHIISTCPVSAIITQNGNSKCFREQTLPVQGKWVQRLYHCFIARKMNKFSPWVEAKGTKFLSPA